MHRPSVQSNTNICPYCWTHLPICLCQKGDNAGRRFLMNNDLHPRSKTNWHFWTHEESTLYGISPAASLLPSFPANPMHAPLVSASAVPPTSASTAQLLSSTSANLVAGNARLHTYPRSASYTAARNIASSSTTAPAPSKSTTPLLCPSANAARPTCRLLLALRSPCPH
ncbi:hypothetical protein B0H14DRAFT_3450402 [Mycena olivaceomarginata]|nr:hypothetical protein B0H14DRAFT_3450402 [Mycena olivaceomarginata]